MSEVIISAVKAGTETTNGYKVSEDAIYVRLTGEKPEDHPELVPIETGDPEFQLYELLPNMLTTAKEIVSDSGLKIIAEKLNRSVKEIGNWSCKHIGVSRKSELLLRLTAKNAVSKNAFNGIKPTVYWAKEGIETNNGKVNKDRIYLVFEGLKPEDENFESLGNGLYKVTDHMKFYRASDLLYKNDIEQIADEFNRSFENVSNFQIDYVATNRFGSIRLALAAEDELWRNRNSDQYMYPTEIEPTEEYWNANDERSSIPKSDRTWVDETSSVLGLNPEEWYWNIH